jgi:hypothetical protein
MKNGRFHPPKCRSKLQKMGVLCTHSPKCQAHPHNTKKKWKKMPKFPKKGVQPTICQTAGHGLQATADRRPAPDF